MQCKVPAGNAVLPVLVWQSLKVGCLAAIAACQPGLFCIMSIGAISAIIRTTKNFHLAKKTKTLCIAIFAIHKKDIYIFSTTAK
jgi:hypothetical protein